MATSDHNGTVAVPARQNAAQPPANPPGPWVLLETGSDRRNGLPLESGSLTEYLFVLKRGRYLLLAAALAGACAGFLYDSTVVPSYQSTATLEVTPMRTALDGMGGPSSPWSEPREGFSIENQVWTLQSRTLRERAAERIEGLYKKDFQNPRSRFQRWAHSMGIRRYQGEDNAYRRVLRSTAASLKAKGASAASIIEISCQSADPRVAAAFLGALADEYVSQSVNGRWQSTREAQRWMSDQLETLKKQLEKSEDDLQAYARQVGLLFTSDKDTIAADRLRSAQQEFLKAQAELIQRRARYETASTSSPDAVPEVQSDSVLRGYQSQLASLRQQMADLGVSFTPEHYRVKKLEAQLAEVRKAAESEKVNILTRIRNEYHEAERRERQLMSEYLQQVQALTAQSQKSIRYETLRREVDANRQMYDAMLQRRKELEVAGALRTTNIRVIDTPLPASSPSLPDTPRNLLFGTLLTSVLAAGLMIVREHGNRKVSAPGDVPGTLRVPELGVIPAASADGVWGTGTYGARRELLIESALQGETDVETVTWTRRPSLLAESFRTSVASILIAREAVAGDAPAVFTVTSPSPREGKSTVATNLAIAMAEIGRKTLLIDADMRQPRLHRIFNSSNNRGLSDVLQEQCALPDYPEDSLTRITHIPNLHIMLSGPPAHSISNLLFSERLEQMLKRFRGEFDAVLIDTPPVLYFSDARVIGKLSDATLLVIRADQTRQADAAVAVARLQDDHVPILGMILNDWNPASSGSKLARSYHHYLAQSR